MTHPAGSLHHVHHHLKRVHEAANHADEHSIERMLAQYDSRETITPPTPPKDET